MSYGDKQGPFHNLPVSTPHMTKNFLQQKRFLAQTNGTTYVYDIPDMLMQMTLRLWREFAAGRPGGCIN